MDIQVVTRDKWRFCQNTWCAAYKYSIKVHVGTAETEYLTLLELGGGHIVPPYRKFLFSPIFK